jgi:hypothetical protein
MAQLHTVALQYSDGPAKFAEATKNSEMKEAPEDPIDTKLIVEFGLFYKMTQMPR